QVSHSPATAPRQTSPPPLLASSSDGRERLPRTTANCGGREAAQSPASVGRVYGLRPNRTHVIDGILKSRKGQRSPLTAGARDHSFDRRKLKKDGEPRPPKVCTLMRSVAWLLV